MFRTLSLTILAAGLFLGLGCAKKEADNLAKAQKCLDDARVPTDADNCMTYISDQDSQQANILKCSILITSGGLMESRIVKGYDILKDESQGSKSASFMAVLALDQPNVSDGYDKAILANTYCKASGVKGLRYLSDIIVAGSYLAKTMSLLAIPAFNFEDPASVEAAVSDLLGQCASATPAAQCTANAAALGDAASSISTVYCSGEDADQTVCANVNAAIASAGSGSEAGISLLCALNNKTFVPGPPAACSP